MKDRSPKARDRARQLRQQQTKAEACFWRLVRGRRLAGAKFRRQVPMHGYVVDFACLEARLVIEIDGGIHNHPAVAQRDKARQRDLEQAGWRIMRLSNEDVCSADGALIAALAASLFEPNRTQASDHDFL